MNNKEFDYNFFKTASEAARQKTERTPYTSFSAFRKLAMTMNIALRSEWKAKEEKKAKMREELSSKRVQEKSQELEDAFKQSEKEKQEKLTQILDRLSGNIKNAYERFAMIPPSPEGILKIENAAKRFDTMSETEFYLLAKSSAGNYQELALLQAEAKRHGKDFDIPFEPSEAEENLNDVVSMLKEKVIANIGKDLTDSGCMEMANFFYHEDGKKAYGLINPLTEYFDNLPVYVPDSTEIIPELTDMNMLQGKLANARQICWKNNHKALWEEAVHVGSELQNRGMNTESIAKAEKIIKIVSEMYPDGDGNTK